MEGNPADLTVYADNETGHDHAYYGNGCPGSQTEGSKTPCSTRLVDTLDGETLKNGTYYNFQAATSGTGGTLEPDNTNSSDTFCPLGWQLPYGGTGGDYYDKSKSGKYLLVQYGAWDNVEGMKMLIYPLSFIRAGGYNWEIGTLNNFGSVGYYSTNTNYTWRSIYRISTASFKYVTDPKAFGNLLRCAQLHRRHGGRNRYSYR